MTFVSHTTHLGAGPLTCPGRAKLDYFFEAAITRADEGRPPLRGLRFFEMLPALCRQALPDACLIPKQTLRPRVTTPICRTATPAMRGGTFFVSGAVNSNS